MRALALIAFMGLQLSMFTCGMEIHIDHLDGTASQITHLHHDADDQGNGLMDKTCQMHASAHVFTHQRALILSGSEAHSKQIYPQTTEALP
ncbi:MAG: hypothetical protein Q9M27_00680, partial [Mariprofundaceae bacterium]|nr:hypothetical protein [Mariprofundaceae bacterium]